ncbi:MAG: universal stress protein [Desulfobaccales bacterium]
MIASKNGSRPLDLLVCTDGSAASEGVFEAALALADKGPCRLRLFQALEYNPGFAALALDALPPWEQEARQFLEKQLERAQTFGVEADLVVSRGRAAPEAILAEVKRRPADIVLLGRRGRTDAKTVLMGSVTSRTIGLSPVPILVVPRKGPFTFARLVVACDGSPFSAAAWHLALVLARSWSVRLRAIRVAQKEEEFPEVEAYLGTLQEEADRQGIEVSTFLVQGWPAEALVRAALLLEADLIILGSHGRTGLTRLFMGSVAEQVIGQASCPVLVVKRRT